MAALTATKTGVADAAAGAGVNEYLGLQGPLAGLQQSVTVLPVGDAWSISGGTTWTPTAIGETVEPSPIMAYRVPPTSALLFLGGSYHALTAATEYVRVIRRYFMYGWQGTAAPAAPSAPTVALATVLGGIATAGVYSYKCVPIDSFMHEGAISAASSNVTLTSTQTAVTVTPPALGTGAIGYNIYRTLAGGSTYFYVGTTMGVAALVDALPDASVDQTIVPSNVWATGAVAGETADGPCEITVEVGAVALTGPPTLMIYKGMYSNRQRAVTIATNNIIGGTAKLPLYSNNSMFIAIETAAANLLRGNTNDDRNRTIQDYGAIAVTGIGPQPSAGAVLFFGHQTIGVMDRLEATAAIRAQRIVPVNPEGVLLPPGAEIVVQVGPLATGVASQRHAELFGLLYPTTGT